MPSLVREYSSHPRENIFLDSNVFDDIYLCVALEVWESLSYGL